jgi:Mg-chelatase subunit ChlD
VIEMVAHDPVVTPRYAPIDALPAALRDRVLAHSHGDLLARVRATLAMRASLLTGALPDATALPWPDVELQEQLVEELRAADLPAYCRGDEALTDEIVREWLDVVEGVVTFRRRALRALAEKRCLGYGLGDAPHDGPVDWRAKLGADAWRAVENEAALLSVAFARERAGTRLRRSWGDLTRSWDALLQYIDALFAHTFAPPGLGRGWLAHVPRADLVWLRGQLAALPPLADLVRALGRMRESDRDDAPPAFERVIGPLRRRHESSASSLGAPTVEVRSVERTAEISRMLPSEAVLLAHPTLRRWFRVKLAERALLGYHAEGVLTRRIQTENAGGEGVDTRVTRAERGPIVVVLDTSGSMTRIGDLAAALVLQILVLAHFEKRRVVVIQFSGPGELAEHELSLEPTGIAPLLAFLGVRFSGGTVIEPALARARAVVEDERYAFADLVLVSDGHFFVAPDALEAIASMRARKDFRVHAIRLSDSQFDPALYRSQLVTMGIPVPPEPASLEALADVVHDLRDWIPKG